MSGEHGVRPDAGLLANRVDPRQHLLVPAVVAPDSIGGMVVRQNQRARELFRACQRGLEEIQLRGAQVFGRNDAGVLEHV
jgi:hypothetical protein